MPQEPPTSGVAYASFASVLGCGGVLVDTAGVARPLPDHEALAAAIPEWVPRADHAVDALHNCLVLATHVHPTVRAAALAAFGELARREEFLGERSRVVRALKLGLRDPDPDVRAAAARATVLVEERLG
jgi:hypothetical protein